MLGGTTYRNTTDSSGVDCVLGKGEGNGGKRGGVGCANGSTAFGKNYKLEKMLQ